MGNPRNSITLAREPFSERELQRMRDMLSIGMNCSQVSIALRRTYSAVHTEAVAQGFTTEPRFDSRPTPPCARNSRARQGEPWESRKCLRCRHLFRVATLREDYRLCAPCRNLADGCE